MPRHPCLPQTRAEHDAVTRLARAVAPADNEELALAKALALTQPRADVATLDTRDNAWAFYRWAEHHGFRPGYPSLQEPYTVRYLGRTSVPPPVTVTSKVGTHYLWVFGGVVTGCMGDSPRRFLGLTVKQAKHLNRYGRLPKEVA
jgi:hypothetical protein